MHFKHSYGMIVHNGEKFTAEAVANIYEIAYDIVIVEGCEPEALFMATSDGFSVDKTELVIKNISDPQNKITYIRAGRCASKTDQCNLYMQKVKGDYIWELDSDEIYHPEDIVEIDEILYKGQYECAEIPFWHFWRDAFHVVRGTSWEIPIRRVFKRQEGDLYKSHRPPEIVRKSWNSMKILSADVLREKNIYCYHYGFVDNQRTKWKVAYHCNRGREFKNWFLDHWIGNTGRHYNNMNQPLNTIEEFKGRIPENILDSKWGERKKIKVLHVLPSWSDGGGCTCIRDLIYSSNLGYFDHGLYISGNYSGKSPLIQNIPFYTRNFKDVIENYDIIEFMFWHSMPELTEIISLKKSQKVIVIVPIYNDNSLRGQFDRFYLTDDEKKVADHVVFMTNKALDLEENQNIVNRSVVPFGSDLIFPALKGYHWRTNEPKIVGCIGPFNHSVTYDNLAQLLCKIKTDKGWAFEMVGGGQMSKAMETEFKNETVSAKWIEHLDREAFWKVLSRWDVYCYPMKDMCYCGSEMKIQEACASFIPLVIKPSKGLCNMELEKCGFVCDKYDQVPGAVEKLLNDLDLRRNYQHSARIHALRTMGSHTSTSEMEVIYRALV